MGEFVPGNAGVGPYVTLVGTSGSFLTNKVSGVVVVSNVGPFFRAKC